MRRVGLLVIGVAAAVAAFLGYSSLLGGYDGLPALPEAYLVRSEGVVSPSYPVPLTIEQLRMAFGPFSPEAGTDLDYKNRLQIPGQDGVIACGSPVPDGTPLVTVAPISVALFGKPNARPKPGTVPDVSTFHADRAVIRFDRPITKIDEMNTAKVVGLELASDPDDDANIPAERKDKRKGRIWISHNRKSLDPADHVVVRTTGPVFVQLPDEDAPHDPNVPHVWTSALVEVFDRQNLPRKLRSRPAGGTDLSAVREITENVPPMAALARPNDLTGYAVADILTGTALPPPTVVAHGLKVFLKPKAKSPSAPRRGGERTASFSGVREVLLCEQVQMNLWADGNGGFPGADEPDEKKPAASPNADPPLAAAAVVGGSLDAGTLVTRLDTRSLMLVETPGSFRYNFDTAVATFDVSPKPPPDRQNFVVVTRLSAKNQTDNCICSKLILEMEQKPEGAAAAEPPAERERVAVRSITALGPQVYISAQAEGLEASGAELKHVRDPDGKRTVTTLRGTPAAPVLAKRDGSQLTAGDPLSDAVVEIVGTETVVRGKPQKTSVVSVIGPGRLELMDQKADSAERRSGVATWGKWLKHEKQVQGDRTLDLLKFEQNAAFVDPQSGFSLKSNSIWLWVAADPKADDKATRKSPNGRGAPIGAVPERLIADGDVHVDSEDMVVRKTQKLTVWFRDVPPPKVVVAAKPAEALPPPEPPKPAGGADAPLPSIPALPGDQPRVAQAPPAEKKPIPNPIQLQADTIETEVVRYPVPQATDPKPKGEPATKYELKWARCEENVYVHQDPDPNDPDRPANGVDIRGNKLTLDHQPPSGSVLAVSGGKNANNYAEVSFDGTSIYGQTVVIDQPNNTLSVDGRGRLKVLSGSDVSGNDLSTPSDLQVTWAGNMVFEGGRSFAQFVGQVVVDQVVQPDPPGRPAVPGRPTAETLPAPRGAGPVNTTTNRSNLWCHKLDLTLDRPVYFNQLRSKDRNAQARGDGAERPKLRKVVALPRDDADADPNTRYVVYRELASEKDGTLASGRLLAARQIDLTNRSREHELYAVGPGELRILQPESDDPARSSTDPNSRVVAKPPTADKGEMKLTLVTFRDTMTGTDTGDGTFQKADFANGAVVMNAPSTDLMLSLEPHSLPKGSVYLTCQERMVVSSRKTSKDAPAEQWLDAIGNAEFRDDTRTGLGEKIRYDGVRAVLDGTDKRLATLMANKKGVNSGQSMRAKKFVYNSMTGQVELSESAGGAFSTGR